MERREQRASEPAAVAEASGAQADPHDAESAYQARVWRDLRRNYVAHVVHGLLGQTGFRFINAPTLIPTYLHALTGSDLAVAVARALQYLGMAVSPILSATLIEHRRRVLPTGFVVGALMRLQVLGIALAGLFLPETWQVLVICALLGLFGFFLGMQGVIFNFLMSKVIPVERRGTLVGLRNALAGLTAFGVSLWAGSAILDTNALGNGFAATFLVAFGLTALGLCALLFVKEPEPPQVRARATVGSRLRDLPQLIGRDRQFGVFFACRALGTMGRMAVPFYIIYARNQLQLTGAELGWLTAVWALSQSLSNFAWGRLADRSGFRRVFLLGLGLWISAVLLLLASADFSALLWVIAGAGAGQGGFLMACQNMVLEFGEREDLPMRIATMNAGAEVVAAIGTVLGGMIVVLSSYSALFCTAIVFQVAAVFCMLRYVGEPRVQRISSSPLAGC